MVETGPIPPLDAPTSGTWDAGGGDEGWDGRRLEKHVETGATFGGRA